MLPPCLHCWFSPQLLHEYTPELATALASRGREARKRSAERTSNSTGRIYAGGKVIGGRKEGEKEERTLDSSGSLVSEEGRWLQLGGCCEEGRGGGFAPGAARRSKAARDGAWTA